MSDTELAERLKEKDQKAFEEVIDRFTPLAAGIIGNVSGGTLTKEDIEETTADVFVTLWNNTDKIIPGKLKGYICCIARTKALSKVASVRKHLMLNIDDYDPEDDFSVSTELEKKEAVRLLREIVSEIAMPEREIVIRYYYYCQSITQIAEIMQINPDTAKTKLRRTREKIRAKLAERGFTL